jgi:hypothetical protein
MYYVREYAEGNASVAKFLISDNKKKVNINSLSYISIGQATDNICTDGNLIYMSGRDPFSDSGKVWFVFAIKVSDESLATFSSGVPYSNVSAYPSVLSLQNDLNGRISGIAVSSSYLFVAHEVQNKVEVLNKTTGALLQTLTIPSPRKMYAKGNVIHIISGNNVNKYTINGDGTLSAPTVISGFTYPLALRSSPNDSILLVADGKSSQQIKAVQNNQIVWTFGEQGGYLTNANVNYNKFYFSDRRGIDRPTDYIKIPKGIGHTFVSFEDDNTFWVGDSGNNRVLKYNLSRSLIDEITYQPHQFGATIDKADKTRVFSNFLEWKIDYTKPFNQSWKLVKNWGGSLLPTDHYIDSGSFDSLSTLPNGRTYGFIRNDAVVGAQTRRLFELKSDGTLRRTDISFQANIREDLYEDGSIRGFVNPNGYPGSTPGRIEFRRKNLIGFTNEGDPQWSNWVTDVAIENTTKRDPQTWYSKGSENPGQITANGIHISFDAAIPFGGDNGTVQNSKGYHIGGAKNNKWIWRTAKATGENYSGPYPSNGDFDTGNGVLNAGSTALATGNVVVWGYHGEFWKSGSAQVNKWNFLDGDTGLMLLQIGVTTKDFPEHTEAPAQMAGNSFYPSFVKLDENRVGLWHNDESYHGGLHFWLIEGLNTIKRIKIAVE